MSDLGDAVFESHGLAHAGRLKNVFSQYACERAARDVLHDQGQQRVPRIAVTKFGPRGEVGSLLPFHEFQNVVITHLGCLSGRDQIFIGDDA